MEIRLLFFVPVENEFLFFEWLIMLRVMLNGGHKVSVLGFERGLKTDFFRKNMLFREKSDEKIWNH